MAPPKPNIVKRGLSYATTKILLLGKTSTCQCLLFLLGLFWLCGHQYINVSTSEFKMRGTYFSEASLLSENAQIKFQGDQAKVSIALSQEYLGLAPSSFATKMNWLDRQLQQANPGRIQTYRHVFHTPSVELNASRTPTYRRENVYAILEPRVGANRNEAIVLMAKHRAGVDIATRTTATTAATAAAASSGPATGGVGLLLSLLRHLSTQRWLSKRIIVVMVDGGTDPNGWDGGLDLGVQRWIQDYTSGHLPQTGGALRGAVLLDVAPGTSLHELGVAMQGSNGLLSNLDLVNLMTKSRHPVRKKYSRVVATTRKEFRGGTKQFSVFSDVGLWGCGIGGRRV